MANTDQLKKVPAFKNLSKAQLDKIAQIAEEVEVPAGKVLARQGNRAEEFFYIVEGKAKVEMNGKVADIFAPNDFFGEISLIDRKPFVANITAETPMRLLVVDAKHFNKLLEKTPTLSNEIMRTLCTYVRNSQSQ